MSDKLHMTPDQVAAAMKQHGLQPIAPSATIFASKATFPEKDACVLGRFVHYDAHHGAQTYDRTRECGVLILDLLPQDGGRSVRLRLALDKDQLADAVWMAMVDLRWLSDVEERPRTHYWMVVRYCGEDKTRDGKTYKRFRVTPVSQVVPNAD